MGYYSDVKLITTKKGWARLDAAVCKAEGITKENEQDNHWLTDHTHYVEGKGYVLAEWNNIKWYDWGDNAVGVLMRELNALYLDDIPFEFMRTGEEYEDVEYLHHDSPVEADLPGLGLRKEIEVVY